MSFSLDRLELVQANYDDMRFGTVSVYVDPDTNRLIMLKEKQSSSEDEHDETVEVTQERLNLSHPCILQMLTMRTTCC